MSVDHSQAADQSHLTTRTHAREYVCVANGPTSTTGRARERDACACVIDGQRYTVEPSGFTEFTASFILRDTPSASACWTPPV